MQYSETHMNYVTLHSNLPQVVSLEKFILKALGSLNPQGFTSKKHQKVAFWKGNGFPYFREIKVGEIV